MSEVRVNNIVDYGGKGAPTFDNGAVISGVSSLREKIMQGASEAEIRKTWTEDLENFKKIRAKYLIYP